MQSTENASFYGADDSNLRPVDEIPPPFNKVFAKYRNFNVLQSRVLDEVFYTDNPLVVSAPTGSGKTVVFELAIVSLLVNRKYCNTDSNFKVVYVAPIKALCEERLVDWHSRFSELGLRCISATGDSDNIDHRSLMGHDVIVTTPEKWDAITRRWKDNRELVEAVRLFMIDEVHLLNDESRGPTLEAVVSRMKIIQSYLGTAQKIRFIAVSATIPNAEDIAEWLDQCSTSPVKCFKFSEDIRPVQLIKIVLGYPFNPQISTPFKFDIMLNYKLYPVMLKYSEGRPVLIFCSTRKSVEMTAKHLSLNVTIDLSDHQKTVLEEASRSITDSKVRELLSRGIACHHAGMLPENRRTVETLFREGNLPVLVATSTLAMGVNLPAHLVIVKTTKYYVSGEYRSYSESAMLQMIGRAGRPGYDEKGYAVIMATAADKEKYEKMLAGNQCVESTFHLHLTEHLNSEVVLNTVSDLTVAMEWLTSTFLYVRAKKHPKHYGLPLGLTSDQLDKRLLEMCQIEINKLAKVGMLLIDENTSITPTLLGFLMAKYFVAFETMKLLTQLRGTEILPQMLDMISNCKEFSDLYLRVNDKKALNLLNKCKNKETIRFPLCGRIKTLSMKINCLIQAVFGSLEVLEHSLQNDAQKIMRSGERISKCLLEYLESPEFINLHPKSYSALYSANILTKCFHARLWENSKHIARQLPGIGIATSSQLVLAGKTSFEQILESNPRDLERILGKKPPYGSTVQDFVMHLPKYVLQTFVKVGDGVTINLNVRLENALQIEGKCSIDRNSYMVLLVGDSFGNIFFYEKYSHDYMIQNGQISKSFIVSNSETHEVRLHFISQTFVGIDCEEKIILNGHGDSGVAIKKVIKKVATNKNSKEVKPRKTVQQFLDDYMKKKKPRRKPAENNQASESASKSSSDSSDKLEVQKDNIPKSSSDSLSQIELPKVVETKSSCDALDTLTEICNGSEAKSMPYDNCVDEIQDFEEGDDDYVIYNVLDEDPSLSCIVSQQNQETKPDHVTEYLFKNVFKEDNPEKPDSTSADKNENFHAETEQSGFKNKRNGGDARSITWSSPLITSPVNKYSPVNLRFEIAQLEVPSMQKSPDFSVRSLDRGNVIAQRQLEDVSVRRRGAKFLLADKDYADNHREKMRNDLRDFCSEWLLEDFKSIDRGSKSQAPKYALENNDTFDSIKVFEVRTASPLSDRSDTSYKPEMSRTFGQTYQKPECDMLKENSIRNILSQFRKENKVNQYRHEVDRPSKWAEFLEKPEDETPKRNMVFTPGPKRNQSEDFFGIPSEENYPLTFPLKENPANFEPPLFSSYPVPQQPLRPNYYTVTPRRRHVSQTFIPRRNEAMYSQFVPTTLKWEYPQTYEEPLPYSHCYSQQVARHRLQNRFATQRQCNHCSCCRERSPIVNFYEPDEDTYENPF